MVMSIVSFTASFSVPFHSAPRPFFFSFSLLNDGIGCFLLHRPLFALFWLGGMAHIPPFQAQP